MFGDVNFVFIAFVVLLAVFLIYLNSALHLLLTAELIWVTLYGLSLLVSFFTDNLNVVSLTFFMLILSAVEFSVGLVLILLQHIMTRTLDFDVDESNTFKYRSRTTSLLNTHSSALSPRLVSNF